MHALIETDIESTYLDSKPTATAYGQTNLPLFS